MCAANCDVEVCEVCASHRCLRFLPLSPDAIPHDCIVSAVTLSRTSIGARYQLFGSDYDRSWAVDLIQLKTAMFGNLLIISEV